MRWREREAVELECDDCGTTAPADRLFVTVAVPNPQTREVVIQRPERLVFPPGWVEGRVFPDGTPVLNAGGVVEVDVFADSAAVFATKTGTQQPAIRCPECAAKNRPDARTVALVREAGAVVTGPDGKPIQ